LERTLALLLTMTMEKWKIIARCCDVAVFQVLTGMSVVVDFDVEEETTASDTVILVVERKSNQR
jgi:hypothetical protein